MAARPAPPPGLPPGLAPPPGRPPPQLQNQPQSQIRPPPPQMNGANGTTTTTGPPNQTLYIKNLPEKISKNDLRRMLYTLFSSYGPVLDIVCTRTESKKGKSMRGQAHVCFKDIQTATQAMRGAQGFDVCGKEMRISYARGESAVIPRLRGTFVAPEKEGEKDGEAVGEVGRSIFAPPSTSGLANVTGAEGEGRGKGLKRTISEVERSDDLDKEVDKEERQNVRESPAPDGEEESDAPMDEDDDDDGAMDESD